MVLHSSTRSISMQGRGEKYLAECVEQLTRFRVRSQTPTAELIELVEAREFNFEL